MRFSLGVCLSFEGFSSVFQGFCMEDDVLSESGRVRFNGWFK